MALTKTKFLEYTRCPKYVFLEKIKENFLKHEESVEELAKEENESHLKELFSQMIENNGETFLKENKQLEAMLDYYKQVEVEAAKISQKYFKGEFVFAKDTNEQKRLEAIYKNVPLLCFVDIYNENEEEINIIEVKATTSKKYLKLMAGYPKKEKESIFKKEDNCYFLKEDILKDISAEMPLSAYEKERNKLFDRFSLGAYFYDLAFQRFVMEKTKPLKKVHYFLAVLNDKYTFDGTYLDGKPKYEKDQNGEELIVFFQADSITERLQKMIAKDLDNLLKNIESKEMVECPLSAACGYKTQQECKYFSSICANKLPKTNNVLSYMNNPFGFTRKDGTKLKGLDLVNAGYYDLLDIPESWITKENHRIQRKCYQNHCEYINKAKIKCALDSLEYPIYHLDFETFPCPLPRFLGEHPYTQSPFEFSLHVEREPGVCDKEKDHVVFLAKSMHDEREELIKTLLSNVNVNKGTLFAQNVAFEKGKIKELAAIFPKYHDDLMKLYARGFDLLWIVNNKEDFYKTKGFDEKDYSSCNFYDERLSGSYSIKKTLPVFSSLSYQDLEVKNGTEAIIVYANYPKMNKKEFAKNYKALVTYCTQDTWAMVEILDALRQKIK